MNIIQIFDRKEIVPKLVKENILKLNPGCNYKLYDFKDGEEFIRNNYIKKLADRIVNKMHSLKRIAHKSDLLRYCILYKLGGMYLDIDLEQIVSLKDIVKDYDFCSMTGQCKEFTTYKKNTYDHDPIIANGFLYTKKMNPFIRKEIEYILNIPDQQRHGVICYHFYHSLKTLKFFNSFKFTPFKEFELNNFKCYFYRETYNKQKKHYTVNDFNDNILMNSNLNNYPPGFSKKKKKY